MGAGAALDGGGQTQTSLKNMGMSLQSYLIRYKFYLY